MADLTDNEGAGITPAPERDRSKIIEGMDTSLASLIGSWFHRLDNDEMVWQGQIVSEPAPGKYLCQVQQLGPNAKNVQVIIPMEQMVYSDEGYEWRFYNTQADASEAFVAWELARERS